MNHRGLADSLLAVEASCPPGLVAWNGSDPGRRFAIYRNNVMVSLIDALADTCPVTQALVGEAFFRAMAALFARANPPHSPVMAHYGEGLAEFIEGFPAAAGLPYLADVARLELLRVQAYHAGDAEYVPPAALARLLSDPQRLAGARFALQPSLRYLVSNHAVVSLWAAHQSEDVDAAVRAVDIAQPECALVVRVGLDVEIHRIATGTAMFVRRLNEGLGLSDAAGRALAADPAFALSDALGLLIGVAAISEITNS